MRTNQGRDNQGFTLVELMITITIFGILVAIAVPSITSYMKRSKTSEAMTNLNQLYKSAASYYSANISGKGITSTVTSNCTVDDAGPEPATPAGKKQSFVIKNHPAFVALSFQIADFVYYSYGVRGVGGGCGHTAEESLYTFYANGDLDADGTLSTFELLAGTDEQNGFRHSRGLYISSETE